MLQIERTELLLKEEGPFQFIRPRIKPIGNGYF